MASHGKPELMVISSNLPPEYHDDALTQGQQNLPASNSVSMNACELRIVSHHQSMHELVSTNFEAEVSAMQAVLDGTEMIDGESRVARIEHDAQLEMSKINLIIGKELKQPCENAKQAERDLKAFRVRNHRNTQAIYPLSHVHHYSVLVALVLLEAAANMYFFAVGSPSGDLGGFQQALVVSLINVGMA